MYFPGLILNIKKYISQNPNDLIFPPDATESGDTPEQA